jgi:hypothetical protein
MVFIGNEALCVLRWVRGRVILSVHGPVSGYSISVYGEWADVIALVGQRSGRSF